MTLLYGHRGARGEAPENTLAGFRRCLEDGVNRCELDLHLSRDGELMVIHDPTLERTTGHWGSVGDLDASELVRLDARMDGPGWPHPCPVPRLADLFEACDFEHWQLEVKSTSPSRARRLVETLMALVQAHGLLERVTLTSSSPAVLEARQALAPVLSAGLVAERWRGTLERAARYDCQLLALKKTLCSPERLAQARAAGLHVSVWTVNEPDEMRCLAAMGVDSLITDQPALAVRTLAGAGRPA